jgi:hypothetical protein
VTRASVRLDLRCDNRCIFCAQDGLVSVTTDVENSLSAARAHADEVTFIGGEPTLDERLPDAVARARALGFVAVGVQTNGRSLAQRERARALVAAGLTDAHVSIHGADAAAHDYHTGVAGSFEALTRGVAHLREAGACVVATTVATRSSFRGLGELPALLVRLGVAAWVIDLPHAAGRAAAGFDRVIPRLGLAVPYALHAIDRAGAQGLPSAIAGAPLCVLGPKRDRAVTGTPRSFAPACEGCGARSHCVGVDAAYLARFGDEELRPHDALEMVAPLPEALARMFVGTGELAPGPTPAHASPAQARRGLPVLQRPTPGRDEVRSRARKSGDELRELFPALFDGDDEPP